MRRNTLYAGAVLALAAMFAVLAGSALDLDLESVALLGAAMGAVIALVPDRTPLTRLGGFVAGFVIGWAGYFIRAQFMPDTSTGRAVAVGVVVVLCVAVAALSAERITLWTVILGAGAFAGAYEFTYNAAPPEILSTSLSTATTMAFNVAVGFLAGALVAPLTGPSPEAPRRRRAPLDAGTGAQVAAPADDRATLDSLMKETAK
jgi:hypothetical protein